MHPAFENHLFEDISFTSLTHNHRRRGIEQFTFLEDAGHSGAALPWCVALKQPRFHVTEASVSVLCESD